MSLSRHFILCLVLVQPRRQETRLQFFFQDLWTEMTHFSKKWRVIFWNDGPKHIELNTSIFYLHTDTDTCVHICILSKTYLKRPLKKEDQLYLNADQKHCRMLQREHSSILLTFIKLPFVIKIFVLSFLSGCIWQVLLYWQPTLYFLFCGLPRLAVRWIFLLKWDLFTP